MVGRTVIILTIFLLVAGRPILAQDSTHSSTKLERTAWVVGSSMAFSLFDYVGFNFVKGPNHAPLWYRAIQTSVQAGLSYLLYKKLGLNSAISFNLIWLAWGDDIGYYGWASVFNPAAVNSSGIRWENREHNGLRDNHITWAYWTPIGWFRPYKSVIARDALIAQALIGFSVAIVIL
jgi:hypothetical protein